MVDTELKTQQLKENSLEARLKPVKPVEECKSLEDNVMKADVVETVEIVLKFRII